MHRRTWTLVGTAFATLLTAGAITAFNSVAVSPSSSTTWVEPDGVLHIPALNAVPPSEFWSPQLREIYPDYVRNLSAVIANQLTLPPADAPRKEWERFDRDSNRLSVDKPLAWLKSVYPVIVDDTKIAGVRVGIIKPRDGVAPENAGRVLINLHGGGFLTGRGLGMGQLESIPIASLGRMQVITIDYRQAPYHRYPAATQDVQAVYATLLKDYKPASIGIFGTSAGGALAAQVLAALDAAKLPRPGAVGIFWSGTGPFWLPGFGKNGDSAMWARAFSALAPSSTSKIPSINYMEGADPADPLANPTVSDVVLARFPPTLFITGTRAHDMSHVITAHARLLKLGVESSLYVMEGFGHAADLTANGAPEQRDVNAYKARWFDQHLLR